MSRVFFEELALPQPDHYLGVGSGAPAAQTARIMETIEGLLLDDRPDVVVVPGDVNSTLAAALAAAKQEVPVAHIEAGLRSFDRTMPEELNRLLTDQLSDLLFIHSPEAADNLAREGIDPEKVHFVGNTMIDTLVSVLDRADDSVLARHGLDVALPPRHAAPARARRRRAARGDAAASSTAWASTSMSSSRSILGRAPRSTASATAFGRLRLLPPGRLPRVPRAAARARRRC